MLSRISYGYTVPTSLWEIELANFKINGSVLETFENARTVYAT